MGTTTENVMNDDGVCGKCGQPGDIAEAEFFELELLMRRGKPFEKVMHCEHCGAELCTMHFHGVGKDALKRFRQFKCPPGQRMGESYVTF